MEPNELNIQLPSNMEKDVVIRTGEALPLKEKRQLSLSGIITTVGDFVVKRYTTFEKLKANVVANYTQRHIVLIVDEDDAYFGTVTGKLELHPELRSLNINSNTTYDEKDLLKKLNFFARWFKSKEAHQILIGKLQKFKVKVNQVFTNADDFKGAAAIEKITNIEHDIDLKFDLAIPIFSGFENREFKVDICVSMRNGEIIFWLESVELHTLILDETDKVFNAELARLDDYVIVKQW